VSLSHFCRLEGWLGTPPRFVFHESVSSTHDVLRELAEHGAPEGTVVLAEVQTAGRGRLGRQWLAAPETSLLLSLLFRPQEPFVFHASRVTMACGLALQAAVREVTGLPVALKWPNDLIVEREAGWGKLAGLLAEIGALPEAAPYLMVGIGVNVNVPLASLQTYSPQATSLLVETGRSVDRSALLLSLLRHIEARYDRLSAGWDPLPEWRAALAWMGQPVRIHTPTGEVGGVAVEVLEDGALLVRTEAGELLPLHAGDVSLRK